MDNQTEKGPMDLPPPSGERIEVRGDSEVPPSPPPSPAKTGEGDIYLFYIETINNCLRIDKTESVDI